MRVWLARIRATVTAVIVFGYVGVIAPFFVFLSWLSGDVMWIYRCAQAGCRIGMALEQQLGVWDRRPPLG